MGDSRFARCLQGGGVFVNRIGGTVSIVNSQVYSNQATYVRAHAQEFPMGDLLTRLPRLSLGNCGRRSCQLQDVRTTETSNFPIARWESC
jgi:hypothetical protein